MAELFSWTEGEKKLQMLQYKNLFFLSDMIQMIQVIG